MPENLPDGSEIQMSEDGKWVWTGTQWIAVSGTDEPAPSTPQATGVSNAFLGSVTPDNLLHGVQRGDTTKAAAQRALADESAKGAAEARVNEQQHAQIASRDPRVEGDKDAATRAASQYQQRMAQISGAAGGGAAALASMNVQDPSASYSEHRQRADAQRLQAQASAAQARGEEQEAIARRATADMTNEVARNDARANNAARTLSQGGQVSETARNGAPGGPPIYNAAKDPIPEEKYIERVQHALQPLSPGTAQYNTLYQQGLSAIKAWHADPQVTAPWEQFKRDADATGTDAYGKGWTPVSEDPTITRDEGQEQKWDAQGNRVPKHVVDGVTGGGTDVPTTTVPPKR